MKKKIILSSIMTIAVCLSIAVGATFALFTSESKVNIAATAGTVEVVASVNDESVKLYSLGVEQTSGVFENLGTATLTTDSTNGTTLTLDNITPGDKVAFTIDIENNSTVNVKYRIGLKLTKGMALFHFLEMKVADSAAELETAAAVDSMVTSWESLAPTTTDVAKKYISVELPEDIGNVAQKLSCEIGFTVEAVQGNGSVAGAYNLPMDITEESFANATEVYVFTNNGNDYNLWQRNVAATAYYNGKYYAGLSSAINAVRLDDSASDPVIYLKPGATTAEYGNSAVTKNVTIYGNGATVGADDPGRLEIEHTDGVAHDAVLFTDDVTLNIYDLNNVTVWGYRKTEHSLTVNATGCSFDRFFITGTAGDINANLKACKFIASAYDDSALYSNANGTITLDDCLFYGMNNGINFNHKVDGTQNVIIRNTAFLDCGAKGDQAYYAPVRMYEKTENAIANLTVTGCVFNYTAGKAPINNCILLNKIHDGVEAKGNINYTVQDGADVCIGVNCTRV